MSEIGLVQGVIKEVDKISKSNASFYCFYRNFYFFRSDSLTHDSWLIDSFDSLILYTPRHTNFCKILWLWGGVSPLVFDKSHSNVAILTNFKVLFWVVSTDFPELVHVESWKNCEKVYVTEHCSLSTDSLPTHPDSLQIELIHLLYSTCWGEDLSSELPLLKKFFHVMSNVESLDNQTFLSYLVDSFIDVFQLQDFHLFLYFCFISQKNMVEGFRGAVVWRCPQGVIWEGQPVGGLVGLPCSSI